jgi:hypothetical protein
MSAADRKRIAAAQKLRWVRVRHGYVEAKDKDAVSNLADLLVVVLARVQRIRMKNVYRTMLDGKAGEML